MNKINVMATKRRSYEFEIVRTMVAELSSLGILHYVQDDSKGQRQRQGKGKGKNRSSACGEG
jgi:hypothetical protein